MLGLVAFLSVASALVSVGVDLKWAERLYKWTIDS